MVQTRESGLSKTIPLFPDLPHEDGPPDSDAAESQKSPRGDFTFIDLFAGIGGIRIGLSRAGGRCVYSCEIDRFARLTYEANFGPCEGSDIRAVDANGIPDHDVLTAGFPCQPFSIAGVSKKLSLGREHGFRDEKSGNLFFEIIRILDTKRPAVVFLENVKNLQTHDHGRTMQVILAELDRVGYDVSRAIVDARHWVPQHRERTFLVGFRRDVYGGRRFVFPPVPRSKTVPKLRDVLEPSWDRRYVLSEHLWKYLQDYREKHRLRGNGFGFGLFGGDDVARTLSARYHKDGSEILIDTGSRLPRRLTPTECAALMGFPSPTIDRNLRRRSVAPAEPLTEFVIPVSDTQAYRQFGNAVVVDVIEHLGLALVDQADLRPVLSAPSRPAVLATG